jgi:hypothetical protein
MKLLLDTHIWLWYRHFWDKIYPALKHNASMPGKLFPSWQCQIFAAWSLRNMSAMAETFVRSN